MTTGNIVCWSCKALAASDQSECRQCKAGLLASGRGISEEQFLEEQLLLRRQLGIVSSAATAEALAVELATPPIIETEESFQFALDCPHCGVSVLDADATFCAKCGGRMIDEGMEAIMGRVRVVVATTVPQLVAREVSGSMPHLVSWDQFPDNEKWKIAWGVWWRMAVVSAGLYAALFLVMGALVSSQ